MRDADYDLPRSFVVSGVLQRVERGETVDDTPMVKLTLLGVREAARAFGDFATEPWERWIGGEVTLRATRMRSSRTPAWVYTAIDGVIDTVAGEPSPSYDGYCMGVTAKGARCRKLALTGLSHCRQHADPEDQLLIGAPFETLEEKGTSQAVDLALSVLSRHSRFEQWLVDVLNAQATAWHEGQQYLERLRSYSEIAKT